MKTSFLIKTIYTTSLLAATAAAFAQGGARKDSTIKTQQLNIYSTYKPEIAPAPKPEFIPSLPVLDINASRPSFEYNVREEQLNFSYRSLPLRPLAMKINQEPEPYQNYVKLGLGNIRSYLIDAGIGSLKGKDYDAALHFNHLSQKSDVPYKSSSRTAFDAGGNYYFVGHVLSAGLNFSRNAFRQYGYDATVFQYNEKDVKQVFTGFGAFASLANTQAAIWNLWYKPTVALYFYGDRMGAKENTFQLEVPLKKQFDSVFSASLGLKANITQFKNGNVSSGNNYFQIKPFVDISLPAVHFKIGVYPTFAKDKVYLFPDISATTKIAKNKLSIFAGWKKDLVQNTYKDLSTLNPYINNLYNVQQGVSEQVYGGFETSLGSHLTLGGTLSYNGWSNMALFINDYAKSLDGRSFRVVYDNVSALGIDAKIAYMINNKFTVSGGSSWRLYQAAKNDKAWHHPELKMSGAIDWTPIDKLTLGATLHYWDRIFSKNADGTVRKLSTIVDLGAHAEYKIIPRLSVFATVNNLLNQQYQMLNQYDVYGFNIIGGVRFKF